MKVEDEANSGVQIRPELEDSRSSVESMENISRRLSA
jgi:hypothetical protein